MDKTLHIEEEVHRRLTLFKAEHSYKSLSDAIDGLLVKDAKEKI